MRDNRNNDVFVLPESALQRKVRAVIANQEMVPVERRLFTKTLMMEVAIACATAIICGCASTFLISKDCKTYYFGSTEEELYKMLCTTGDLMKILDDSPLSLEMRSGIYGAQCSERSKEQVDALYRSLTREEKRALKSAFVRHGYYVNYKPIGNYDYDNYRDNINFCPPGTGY